MNTFQVILTQSDLGASKRGASMGPGAILKAATAKGFEFFKNNPPSVLSPSEPFSENSGSGVWGKNIRQIGKICRQVSDLVFEKSKNGRFLLLLSGDHSTAAGTLAGIKRAWPDDSIGVIWIDAHADLHSPFTTPSGNLHGMPLAASLVLNSLHLQRNQPDAETIKGWEFMKELGMQGAKLNPEHLVYIGLRQMEEEEEALIRELHIQVIPTEEVREMGADRVASKALALLKDCRHLVISFDVDSLDPQVSMATGTPVEGGLTQTEALDLLKYLSEDERVRCLEIVEINPELEPGNKMGEIGLEIVEQTIEIIEKRKSYAN